MHSSTITDITGNRLVYTFDGLGANRQIEGGKPSTTRLKVIHREALELALYTFRYLPDAESITMLLPPPPPTEDEEKADALAAAAGQTPKQKPLPTLFYRPGDLKPQLQVPLGQTIGPKVPSTDSFSGPEADTIETLVLSNRFLFSQTGNFKFVLDRPDQPLSVPTRPVFGMRAPARHLEHPRVGLLDVRARARGRARIRQVSAASGLQLPRVRAYIRR